VLEDTVVIITVVVTEFLPILPEISGTGILMLFPDILAGPIAVLGIAPLAAQFPAQTTMQLDLPYPAVVELYLTIAD